MKKKVIFAIVICTIVAILGGYYNNHKQFDVKEIERKIALEDNTVEENETEDVVIISPGDTIPSEIVQNTKITKGSYTIKTDLIVNEGITLEVEAGSTLNFKGYNTKITINGVLGVIGTEEEKINFNYETYGSSFILITETGKVDAVYFNLNNTASPYSNYTIRAIDNNGTLIMNYSKVSGKGYVVNNIYNTGFINVTNTEISNNLIVNNIVGEPVIQNNTILGTIEINLETCNEITFDNIKENYNEKNILKTIILTGEMVNNVKLSKQSYTRKADLIIPENLTLELEAGSTLHFTETDKQLIVNGIFKVSGMEEETTYIFSHSHYKSFILINEKGKMEGSYFNYENLFTGYSTLGVVISGINNQGILMIDHLVMKDREIATNLYSKGVITLTNTEISNNLVIDGVVGEPIIKNNTIPGEFQVNLETCNETTFNNIKNNIITNVSLKSIVLTGEMVNSVKLPKQNYARKTDLTIPENTTLELEAGSTLTFKEYKTKIIVNGILKATGTEEENVNLIYETYASSFITIAETGKMDVVYFNLNNIVSPYSNYTIRAIDNKGILLMDNVVTKQKAVESNIGTFQK